MIPSPRFRQRGIAKWPFFLGDALLVLTGVSIAWASPAPLSPVAMAWCVLAVGWGGVLGCTPFLAEYLAARNSRGEPDDVCMRKLYQLDFRVVELEQRAGVVAADGAATAPTVADAPLPQRRIRQRPESRTSATPLMDKALGRKADATPNPAITRIIRGSDH